MRSVGTALRAALPTLLFLTLLPLGAFGEPMNVEVRLSTPRERLYLCEPVIAAWPDRPAADRARELLKDP